MDDIYTRAPITTPSDEHIFPNSLGGRWVSGNLINRSTNSHLGATVDAGFFGTLVHIVRLLVDARAGDGSQAPAFRNVAGPDGTKYNLLPGGQLELAVPQLRVWHDGAETRIEGTVRSRRELRRLVKRKLRERGLPTERVEMDATSTRTPAPRISTTLGLKPDSFRAVAKAACNLFAATVRTSFMDSAFDPIRDFVLRGAPRAADFVELNAEPVDINVREREPLGELDHLVIVRSRGATMEAFVALYAHLQFVVRLGLATTIEVATAYRVDQLGSSDRRDHAADLATPIPGFASVAAVPYEDMLATVERCINRMMAAAMEKQRESFERKLVDEAVRAALGPSGQLTRENVDAVSRAVAEAYTQYLVDQGVLDRRAAPDDSD